MQINGGFVLLSKATATLREPVNYQREFNNDISKPAVAHPWLEKGQRVALVALPFISQYKPLGFLITSTMGTARVWTSSSQLIESIRQGNAKEASYHTLQTTIAALSLASTFFAHPIGMILTTGQDLIIEAANLNRYLRDGEYQKAAESCLKIINNSLYLCSFLHGGIELTIASLAMQIVLGIYQAQAEFRDGRYLEGSGQLLMVVMRGTQLAGQVKILQMKLGMEKLIQEAEAKKHCGFEASVNSGEERITLALKNSGSVSVLQSDKILTEKAIKGSNDELINILIKYGNNSEGIPVLQSAILQNDRSSVDLLLRHSASPFTRDSNGRNCLYYSIKAGSLDMVQRFVGLGININESCSNDHSYAGGNPIFMAIGEQKNDIAKYLLDKGARLEKYGEIDAIQVCASSGNFDFLKLLIARGIKIPDHGDQQHIKNTFFSIFSGSQDLFTRQQRLKCLDLLINHKQIPLAMMKDHSEYLQIIANTSPEALIYLLDHKYLSPNQRWSGTDGHHILLLASQNRVFKVELVKILLERGADIKALAWGRDILSFMVEVIFYDENELSIQKECIKLLLSKGAVLTKDLLSSAKDKRIAEFIRSLAAIL